MNCDLFPCYSVPLMKFLTEQKRIKYKLVGLHPQSKMQFYVFIEDEFLNEALKEWKDTKS